MFVEIKKFHRNFRNRTAEASSAHEFVEKVEHQLLTLALVHIGLQCQKKNIYIFFFLMNSDLQVDTG